MDRDKAEAHWSFIGRLLELENEDGMIGVETVHYLFVEAMLHGAKHEREDRGKKRCQNRITKPR